MLLLHKQAHERRGIAESQLAYITRARLTACEVGIILRKISQLSKICVACTVVRSSLDTTLCA